MSDTVRYRLRGNLTCLCGENVFTRPTRNITECTACGWQNLLVLGDEEIQNDYEPIGGGPAATCGKLIPTP